MPERGGGAAAAIYLTVALRGADPTALTARYALLHQLGYAGVLREVRRLVLWRFELAAAAVADAAARRARVESWVSRSQLFVNPNQHTHALHPGAGAAAAAPAPPHCPWLVVGDEPDLEGAAATRLVRQRLGDPALVAARRALVWQLELAPPIEPARAAALALEIAVARRRDRGLLANPHFQVARVVCEATPVDAGERLWGAPAAAAPRA